jgi:plasmid stabilization system protein ParE
VDFQIRITETALADFEEILAYSWANFPATAEGFGNAILDHLDLLRTFPYIGSIVAGRPGVRQLVHTPILIYYRVDEALTSIDVLHIRHGARAPGV